MLKRLRQLLIVTMMAVAGLGNVPACAMAFGHGPADTDHVFAGAPASHSHDHDHAQGHDESDAAGRLDQDWASCEGGTCGPQDQPVDQACHAHATCCAPAVGLPPGLSTVVPIRLDRTSPFDYGSAIPAGTLFYPLLRPPRSAA